MKSHWELFQEVYNHAPQAIQDFVDTNVVTNFVAQVAMKENIELASDTKRDLLYAINLYLLSKQDIEKIKPYTEKVDWSNQQHRRLYDLGCMLYLTDDDYMAYGPKAIDAQMRKEALKNTTAAQLYLLTDANPRILLNKVAIQYNLLDSDLYKKFITTIEDIILGFYDAADTEPLLIQELGISAEVAKPLAADVREFLAPLDDPNWQPPTEEEDVDQTFDIEPTDEAMAEPQALATPPVVAPTMNSPQVTPVDTPGLRTMAHDMDDVRSPQRNTFEPVPDDGVPTYTSNQQSK